jgi:DNA-binding XRE family transcriptional regulator
VPRPHVRMRPRDLDEFARLRRALGSQREVAELAGCSHQYLGELEIGRKPNCSRGVAVGIARALGMRTDELFVRVDQRAIPAGEADLEVS